MSIIIGISTALGTIASYGVFAWLLSLKNQRIADVSNEMQDISRELQTVKNTKIATLEADIHTITTNNQAQEVSLAKIVTNLGNITRIVTSVDTKMSSLNDLVITNKQNIANNRNYLDNLHNSFANCRKKNQK
jgi:hypothetical protein